MSPIELQGVRVEDAQTPEGQATLAENEEALRLADTSAPQENYETLEQEETPLEEQELDGDESVSAADLLARAAEMSKE
jgi:hypothetical protein